MSADNWAVCPKCKRIEMEAIAELARRIESDYGKIPIDDFLALRNEAINRREALPEMIATFREDYEIYGAEEGAVNINYRGSCKNCGLSQKWVDYIPLDYK